MLKVLPHDLSDYHAYGKWNCLCAYNRVGELIDTIPAHDGDFFPESPFDHIIELKKHLNRNLTNDQVLWPVRVDIDITQDCSDNCYFCYSRIYTNRRAYKNAQIDLVSFEKIVQELAINGTKTIRLTGGGEPLFHPQIKDILPIPKKYGLKSCILTNGSMLNEEICEILVDNTDQIRISLNAASNKIRLKLHRPQENANNLIEIIKLIHYISELRELKWPNEKKPLIWSTFLMLPENVHEMEQAIIIAKDAGVDSISFRPIYHNLSDGFPEIEVNSLNTQLEVLKARYSDSQFYVFIPKKEFATVWNISPSSCFSNCLSCKLRTIIEANRGGSAIKICGLYRGLDRGNLGLLKEDETFAKIWVDPKVNIELRTRPKTCNHCIDISMNVTLNKIFNILLKEPDAVFYKANLL